jgi:hypothetical protein
MDRNAHSLSRSPRLTRSSPSSFRRRACPRVRARRRSLCAARHRLADRARRRPDRPEAGSRAAQAVGGLGPRWQGRRCLSAARRAWRRYALRLAGATRSHPRRARRHLLAGLAHRHRGKHGEMGPASGRSEALARSGEGRRQACGRAPPRKRAERRAPPRRSRGRGVVRLGFAAGVAARASRDGPPHIDPPGGGRPVAEP